MPPFSQQNSLNSPSYQGYTDQELEELLLVLEKLVFPFFDSVEMYDVYRLSGSKWYKAVRYSLPTGPIETGVAAISQGYKDSWNQNLNLAQRLLRMVTVGVETYITDGLSTFAGETAGSAALSTTGNPAVVAVAYGGASALVTESADRFWINTVNPYLIPRIGLGLWP